MSTLLVSRAVIELAGRGEWVPPSRECQLHCPNNLRQVEDNLHLYLTQEVDIGVGPYTISSIRETVVDFSVPFMEDGGGILTKKGNSGISILTGLSTFSGTIWLCVVATTVVMGFSLFVTGKYSPYSDVNMSQERRDTWTLGTCIIYVCGSVMMQGQAPMMTRCHSSSSHHHQEQKFYLEHFLCPYLICVGQSKRKIQSYFFKI